MATTLDVIKTITIRGSTEGVAEVERQLARVAAGMEEVTIASAKQEKATLSVEAAYRKLQTRYDQEFRAQQALAQVQKTLERAQTQGLVSQERASELMQQAIVFHNRTATATTSSAQALGQFGNQSKAARYELINLSRQIQDVGVSLASGQSPFTVLIQQGSQVADVFASSQLTLQQWAQRFLGFFTPARLLVLGFTAAVGALTFAFIKLTESSITTENVLKKQAEAGDQISKAYRDATSAAGRFLEVSKEIVTLEVSRGLRQATELVDKLSAAFTKATTRPTAIPLDVMLPPGFENVPQQVDIAATKFKELNVVINQFNQSAKGWTDVKQLRDQLAAVANTAADTNPELRRQAETLLDDTNELGKAALAAEKFIAQLAVLAGIATAAQRALLGLSETIKATPFETFIQKTRDAIDVRKLETQELGKSAGAAKALRIQQEADKIAREGKVQVDQKVVDSLKREAAAAEDAYDAGKKAFDLGQKQLELRKELARERETAFFSREDQQIAERLKDLYPNVTDAINSSEAAQIRFNNRIREAQDLVGDFINTFVQGMVEGKSVTDALGKSIQSLGAAITQAASKQIGTSIVSAVGQSSIGQSLGGGLGSLFGAGATAFGGPLAGLAVGVGVSLLGKLLEGNAEEQQKQAEAIEQATAALKQSNEQLNNMVGSLKALNDVSGDVTKSIKSAMEQLAALNKAAEAQIQIAKTQGGVTIAAPQAQQAFNDALIAMREASAEFTIFAARTIEDARKALQGSEVLSEMAQKLADLTTQANDLIEALITLGHSAQEAAQIVAGDLAMGLDRLRISVERDLLRRIREATGQGWINQFADLFQEIKDAALIGVQPDLLSEFMRTQAQALIDSGQIMGQQFRELLALYPELTGQVHEYTQALEDQSEKLNTVARNIVDFVKGLFTRAEVGGSPTERLRAAQANYEATLRLARQGNEEALERITAEAETFRETLRAVYGSSITYQQGVQQIAEDLLSLPAVQDSTDQIVNAIRDSIIVLEQINASLSKPIPVQAAQKGGWVTQGVPTRDSAIVFATRDEFVVNRASARRYGGLLEAINNNTLGTGDGGGNIVAEIRGLRSDIMRGFVASSENMREGVDEVAGAMTTLVREAQLKQQAPAA